MNLELEVGGEAGRVSALLLRPASARTLLVLGHGAGAGMTHPFMAGIAEALADRGVATLRYQFPYLERGTRRPDPPALLQATVRAAVRLGGELAAGLPLLAGGKSLGGRMTSTAAARAPLDGVRGLVFFGFPLHPAKQPGTARAEHLARVSVPMLFLQGTRDELADPGLIRSVCSGLGPAATLHVVEGADHGFAVLKRSGRTGEEVMAELAGTVTQWAGDLVASSSG